MKRYISDTHFRHGNIMRYCDRRFESVEAMDTVMHQNILTALEDPEVTLVHTGDVAFHHQEFFHAVDELPRRDSHILILGNHDKVRDWGDRKPYYKWFGIIEGVSASWRTHHLVIHDVVDGKDVKVLLSHAPQQDLLGCDFNVYGHIHNNALRNPEIEYWYYPWLVNSSVHLNASVEVIDYRPRTLAELLALRPQTSFSLPNERIEAIKTSPTPPKRDRRSSGS